MKKVALLLVALALLSLCVVLWQAFHQELLVTGRGLEQVDAEAGLEELRAMRSAVSEGRFVGFVYQGPADAEGACLVRYTLRLRNTGLIPAEMVEMQLVSATGDIAARQEPSALSIAPGAEGQLSLTLLTASKAPLRRDLLVTYYLWGALHTVRYTLS